MPMDIGPSLALQNQGKPARRSIHRITTPSSRQVRDQGHVAPQVRRGHVPVGPFLAEFPPHRPPVYQYGREWSRPGPFFVASS